MGRDPRRLARGGLQTAEIRFPAPPALGKALLDQSLAEIGAVDLDAGDDAVIAVSPAGWDRFDARRLRDPADYIVSGMFGEDALRLAERPVSALRRINVFNAIHLGAAVAERVAVNDDWTGEEKVGGDKKQPEHPGMQTQL